MVRQSNYQGMAQTQLEERFKFRYPPYTRLILLVLRGSKEQSLDEIAELYVQKLKARFGHSVSGPVHPPVTRVQKMFVRKIMLKMEPSLPIADTRKAIEEVRVEMQQHPHIHQLILHYDVDPQ
jgi:primosomal protein N' (replication factor Y)